MNSSFNQYLCDLQGALTNLDPSGLSALYDCLRDVKASGSIVYLCGNGGSAATAEHATCDLSKGAGVQAICLSSNVSLISALANDEGYENIFHRQLQHVRPRDILIAISVSGKSQNVVDAVSVAAQKGCETFALTGKDGGYLCKLCHHCLRVDSLHFGIVEDVHMAVLHMMAYTLKGEKYG